MPINHQSSASATLYLSPIFTIEDQETIVMGTMMNEGHVVEEGEEEDNISYTSLKTISSVKTSDGEQTKCDEQCTTAFTSYQTISTVRTWNEEDDTQADDSTDSPCVSQSSMISTCRKGATSPDYDSGLSFKRIKVDESLYSLNKMNRTFQVLMDVEEHISSSSCGSCPYPPLKQATDHMPIGDIAERFHALCLKDSGVLYEDPYVQIGIKAEWRLHQGRLVLFLGNKNTAPLVSVQAMILPPSHLKLELSLVPDTIPPRAQVQCPLEVVNLRPSRDLSVLDFSYKFGTSLVNIKLRLPAVLNKFLQPIPVSAEEFFPQWKSLSGPPLKFQEVVRGIRPMSLVEMANLFDSFQLMVSPGLDSNANNLVASTTFYSESTRAVLCLVRIETDPADRTQLRMTVASGDPTLTFELKEFIKEQLISTPTASKAPAPQVPPTQAQPTTSPLALSDPGDI